MAAEVTVVNVSTRRNVPSRRQFARWVTAATTSHPRAAVDVRIVDEAESQQLNGQYRDKAQPTNVLAFPADFPEEADSPLLGDLVICAPVVAREAQLQAKTSEAHWAHLVVHGCLHLLGHDHMNEDEARVMEALETRMLAELGYPPPYGDEAMAIGS